MGLRRFLAGATAIALLLFSHVMFQGAVGAATLTLGNTAVGSQTDSADFNYLNGSRFTTGASGGTVTSISVNVGAVGAAPNNQFQVAIYADAGGAPGARLANSASGSLVANTWNTVPISATLAAGTPYWLIYNTNGSSASRNNMKFSTGGSSAFSSNHVTFGTWPASFGSATSESVTFSIYATYTSGSTATPPTVTMTAPASGATIAGVQAVSANASDAVGVSGVQFTLDGQNLGSEDTTAPYSINWDTTTSANGTHTLGAIARNAAGLTATSTIPVTVQNVVLPPPPPPSSGHPILLITDPANPFTTYYTEILTAEGLKYYNTATLAQINGTVLTDYDVVLLGQMALTDAQATMFSDWVISGGKLIAMRPDKKLASLLGLADASATLSEAYLKIDATAGPGLGIAGDTIQYHGIADRYTLAGATAVATLYSDATHATVNPAVTLKSVFTSGGQAAAFTFDLARSIVLTRQGNVAWAGQQRDATDGYEASEMFFGVNGQPNWNNLDKAIIPIADEQQRLLVNLIFQMNQSTKPLPRFWYFPREIRAVVVMTGDDHAIGGTAARFDRYTALSPVGCNVDNWECIRSTSYMYPDAPLSSAEATSYNNQGFEIGLHLSTQCVPWGTAANLNQMYNTQLAALTAKYTGIPSPTTIRTHCVEWDDWLTQGKTGLAHGIRLTTDYYYYPGSFTLNRPGYFNGSGTPMRFADVDGTILDVYNGVTDLTDESGQEYPFTINTLLDKAYGPEGYFASIVINNHTDYNPSPESEAVITAAKAHGVPVVSARQLLKWLDTRNASAFDSIAWDGTTLSFNVTGGANGLTGMVPMASGTARLSGIARAGVGRAFTVQSIKGRQYAFFPATPGTYTATYAIDNTPPVVASTSPASGATGVDVASTVKFSFNEPLDPATVTSASAELRSAAGLVSTVVSYESATNSAVLTPAAALQSSTTYTATVKAGGVRDAAGNAFAADNQFSFTTGAPAPPPPPTIGNNQIGANVDSGDGNYLNGSRVVNGTTSRTISSLSVYVNSVGVAPNNKFQMGIYTDVSGSPGTLVATTAQGTLTGNAWNTLPITATLAPNTAYWFIYNTNAPSASLNDMAYDVAPAGQAVYSSNPISFGTWPSSFGSRVLWGARFSIFGQ
jgi:hypothetical protein